MNNDTNLLVTKQEAILLMLEQAGNDQAIADKIIAQLGYIGRDIGYLCVTCCSEEREPFFYRIL